MHQSRLDVLGRHGIQAAPGGAGSAGLHGLESDGNDGDPTFRETPDRVAHRAALRADDGAARRVVVRIQPLLNQSFNLPAGAVLTMFTELKVENAPSLTLVWLVGLAIVLFVAAALVARKRKRPQG